MEAEQYLKAHNVDKLFKTLGTRLLFERPEDPNAFLIEELGRMRTSKQGAFFDEADVRACFSAFDVTNTGKIDSDQYATALKSLGIEGEAKLEEDSIDRESFVSSILEKLKEHG